MKRTGWIVGLLVLAVVELLSSPLDRFEPARAFILEKMKKEGLPSLAVAVAQNGKIIWEEAWGWANIEKQIPATPQTMYSLASTTKPVTATALMILVERGLVDLDKPANFYLGEGRLFIAPDNSEIVYWEREAGSGKMRIVSVLNKGGVWSEPEVLPFSEEYINMEPCLSPDGKKMFFVSNRPLSGKGEGEKFPNIWMVEKNKGTWGEPRNIGDPVNSLDIVVQPFYTVDDKLYFCGENADRSSGGMYVSEYSGNGFSEPEKLEGDISSGQFSGPCVSPDNRMLILHTRKNGGRFKRGDLYVSFRDATGNWGELVNLGEAINTEEEEHGATFSPDGRHLFFSRAGDIYWVSAKVLEKLKPK
jgi:hypothetical protein